MISPFHTYSKNGLFLYTPFPVFTLFMYTKLGMAKILLYDPKYSQIKISYKWFICFFWLYYVIAPCNFKGC